MIERLTTERANGKIPRKDQFRPDPDLEKGKRAELKDYKKSGYAQGHIAPAADMKWSEQVMKECFYLSNMVPQNGRMNSGIWQNLEGKVRKWAKSRGEVFIFTGPIYEDGISKAIGINQVAVPTHLYKIVYDAQEKEAIAFIMQNVELNSIDMPSYIVTIREVEEKTGLDFLSALDKEEQDAIETEKPDGVWK